MGGMGETEGQGGRTGQRVEAHNNKDFVWIARLGPGFGGHIPHVGTASKCALKGCPRPGPSGFMLDLTRAT